MPDLRAELVAARQPAPTTPLPNLRQELLDARSGGSGAYPNLSSQAAAELWGPTAGVDTEHRQEEPGELTPADRQRTAHRLHWAAHTVPVPPRSHWPLIKARYGGVPFEQSAQWMADRGELAALWGPFLSANRSLAMKELDDTLTDFLEGRRELTPGEFRIYSNTAKELKDEFDYRQELGKTTWTWAKEIGLQALPFVADFMLTAGVAGTAKAATRAAVRKAWLRGGARAAATPGRALRATMSVAGGAASAGTRTLVLPGYTMNAYAQARLAGDEPHTALLKGLAYSFGGFATEEMGPHLMNAIKWPGKWGAGKLAKRFSLGQRAYIKSMRKLHGLWVSGGKSSRRFWNVYGATGIHGVGEEMAEEQAEKFWRWIVEAGDADLVPTRKELGAQAIAFTGLQAPHMAVRLPAAVREGLQARFQRVAERRTAGRLGVPREEVAQAVEEIRDLETQRAEQPVDQPVESPPTAPEAPAEEAAVPEAPERVISQEDYTPAERAWERPINPEDYGIAKWQPEGEGRGQLVVPLPPNAGEGLVAELENALNDQGVERTQHGRQQVLKFWTTTTIVSQTRAETAAKMIRRWQENQAEAEQAPPPLDNIEEWSQQDLQAEAKRLGATSSLPRSRLLQEVVEAREAEDAEPPGTVAHLPAPEAESHAETAVREVADADQTEYRHAGFNAMKVVDSIRDRVGAAMIKMYRLWLHGPKAYQSLRELKAGARVFGERTVERIKARFKGVPAEVRQQLLRHQEDPTKFAAPEGYEKEAKFVNRFFKWFGRQLERYGLAGQFPANWIADNNREIDGLRHDIEDMAALPEDASPQQKGGRTRSVRTKERRIAKLEQENQNLVILRYARHLVEKNPSLGAQLHRWRQEGKFTRQLSPEVKALLGRKYATLAELREALKDRPDWSIEEDVAVVMVEYAPYAMQKLATWRFHEDWKRNEPNLVKAIEIDEETGERSYPEGWQPVPGIPNYNDRSGRPTHVVHPYAAEAFRDVTETSPVRYRGWKWYDSLNRIFKQLKFYKAWIMLRYNLEQQFVAAGGATGFAAVFQWKKAVSEVRRRGPIYRAYQRMDLFPVPGDIRFKENLDTIRHALFALDRTNNRTGQALLRAAGAKTFRGAFASILKPTDMNLLLSINRSATWWLDRTMRTATAMALEKQGLARAAAVERARSFHADYDMLRAEWAKWARRTVLTPAYTTAMWGRLFPKLIGGVVRGRKGYAKMSRGEATAAMARVAIAYSVAMAAASLKGYAWLQAYRLVRGVRPGDDEPEERILLISGPFSDPLRVFQRAYEGYRRGAQTGVLSGVAGSAKAVFYNKLAAIPHAIASIERNRDWKGEPIVTPDAPSAVQNKELLGFLAREFMPLYYEVGRYFEKDSVTSDNLLYLIGTLAYTRKPQRQFFIWRMKRKRSNLNRWVREASGRNPELAGQYSRMAGEDYAAFAQNLVAELERYEDKTKDIQSLSGMQRVVRQFTPSLMQDVRPDWALRQEAERGLSPAAGRQRRPRRARRARRSRR